MADLEDPAVRGRGLGRVLLSALEAESDRLGWSPIAKYGEYKDEEDSRCYEKVAGANIGACLSPLGG